MKLNRTKNTIRNTFWGMIYRIVTLIGPFVVKTILVKEMGLEYSGLSSLFTSILTVLNLTNLGFNSSIVFTMYKAIVDDNIEEQCAMLNFYRKAYRVVGTVILGLGFLVMPFLPYLVKGNYPKGINIYILFGIYLAETVIDYFVYAYNIAVFTAYQRNDITLRISTVRYSVQYVIQATVLILFKSYYLYILTSAIMIIPNNIANHIICKKIYPEITCRGTIGEEIKSDIFKRVITLFGHKLGNTMLVSVDSIIISAFLGLEVMGLYGNYYYILTEVNALVEIVTNGAISGIGNKLFTDTKTENYKLFKQMTYGWLFLIGLSSSCMMNLYQPFIGGIWYDEGYLLNTHLVFLIVLYFYAWMFRIMQLTYRDAAGLWTKDWLKPYVAMVLNLTGSIYLVKTTGSIAGVLVPTIAIFFFVYYPWEGRILFKYLFARNMRGYVLETVGYMGITFLGCGVTYILSACIMPNNSVKSFVIRFLITITIFPALWILLTHKKEEYKILRERLERIIERKCNYRKN